MTLYLAPPSRTSTSVSYTTQCFGRVLQYNSTGNLVSDTPVSSPQTYTYSRSSRSGLTRNKVSNTGGIVFKPCTTYSRGAQLITFQSGTLEVRRTNGNLKYRETGVGNIVSRAWFGPFMNRVFTLPASAIGLSTNTRNRLQTEILLKIGSRKASYGEALAESKTAVNHLAHTATTLVKVLLDARRGRWSNVARHLNVKAKNLKNLKTFSSRWLEYQYAWLPLISDLYDTQQLIQRGFREKVQLMSSVRRLNDYDDCPNSSPHSRVRDVSGHSQRTDIMKVFYKVDDSSLSKLNQIGLLNPVEVAWAVVPYSFVVDWFLPVGNFLEACTATVGCTFIDGYVSSYISGKYTAYPDLPTLVSGEVFGYDTRQYTTEFMDYQRTKLSSFPKPALYMKSPFSTSHVASALALINQLRK
jgi:hypothetical protein